MAELGRKIVMVTESDKPEFRPLSAIQLLFVTLGKLHFQALVFLSAKQGK